jgi:signal transduction histidine kinase
MWACVEAVRQQTHTLIDRSSAAVKTGQIQVLRSLMTSRVGVALIAVIGLAAFYMYLRQAAVLRDMAQREQETLSHERDRLEELERERTASLSKLANYLQQVREEERAHLARELHDELGALLTAAKLDVSRVKAQILPNSDEVRTRLDHLVQSLHSGIALKRRNIEDLRPSTLSNLGLEAALKILLKEYAGRAAMEAAPKLFGFPPTACRACATGFRPPGQAGHFILCGTR